MKDTKKGRLPVYQTERRQAAKFTYAQANSIPQHNFTTISVTGQGAVSRYLRQGEQNSTSTRDLMKLVGCRTVKALQALIKAEREQGVLILSSTQGGYFLLNEDPQEARKELLRFTATLRSRAINTLRTVQQARIALDVLDGQLEFTDAGEIGPARVGGGPVG